MYTEKTRKVLQSTFSISFFALCLFTSFVSGSTYAMDDDVSLTTHVTGSCNTEVFENFLAAYNKTGMYGPSTSNEYKLRCGYVTRANNYINQYNASSYAEFNVTMGLNSHVDMSVSEMDARNGAKIDYDATESLPSQEARQRRLSQRSEKRRQLGESLPSSINYDSLDNPFERICVTSVKDQGACGVSLHI